MAGHELTWLTMAPLLGAAVVACLPRSQEARARPIGLSAAGIALAWALGLALRFQDLPGYQFVERLSWIPYLGVEYHLGVDGLGLAMALLTGFVMLLALTVSRTGLERPRLYYALFLLLEAGLMGTFTALNFFHWFLCWELSLIPAFFLIRLWGGPMRGSVSTGFFLYTLAGSVAMLLAFQVLFLATGTFDLPGLARLSQEGGVTARLSEYFGWPEGVSRRVLGWVGAGVFLGLAVKVPLMPLHGWLPGAYAEAPTAVTMVLTGVMSKMGLYGFLRIMGPIFADAMRGAWGMLMVLAVVTVVGSAAAAWAQKDLKRLLAYSSINHLGYCLLGIFAALQCGSESARQAALGGVILQMFNHGINAATLFGLVAFVERRSGGLRGLDDFGGLRKAAPVFCGVMGMAVFASLGLPGLNGFPGEFLIFTGVFAAAPWAAVASVLGLLLTAVFLLGLMQRMFHGPLPGRWSGWTDLSPREWAMMIPSLGLMLVLGVYPQALLGIVNAAVVELAAVWAP